jgi:hypothetical protein
MGISSWQLGVYSREQVRWVQAAELQVPWATSAMDDELVEATTDDPGPARSGITEEYARVDRAPIHGSHLSALALDVGHVSETLNGPDEEWPAHAQVFPLFFSFLLYFPFYFSFFFIMNSLF